MGSIWSFVNKSLGNFVARRVTDEDFIRQYPEGFPLTGLIRLGYHLTDNLIYQPETPPESRIYVPSPSLYSLPFETVYINTSDRVRLHGYLLKQQRSLSCPVIIHFHGNAGNIGHRLESAKDLFEKVNCNVLLVEYRGYGLSDGSPSETGFYTDAKSAFQFVENRDDLDSSKVILFGRSLGGAVAIDLASRCDFRDRIYALIVENTFTSIPDIAKHLFPVRAVNYLPRFCYKSKFETKKKISSIVCPTLFISGTKDELIPPQMMVELYDRCSSYSKQMAKIPGGTHNDSWHCKTYPQHICQFLDQVSGSRLSKLKLK